MRQTWRWFGPKDLVAIDDVRQAGAQGIVSALHFMQTGAVWQPADIEKRKQEIACMNDSSPSGLAWEVVESLPVSEDIKKQKGDWRAHFANYRESLKNIAAAGIEVVCYNFMPVLDWTRTDLAWKLPHGGTCMRFDYLDFAAFDLNILKRKNAKACYAPEMIEQANRRYADMNEARRKQLAVNVSFGLPGAAENMSMEDLRAHLEEHGAINPDQLRRHFIDFLQEVVPTAEQVGIRMCCHPDDPPFPLLGLPRIMSTEADHDKIMEAVNLQANGITLCPGSIEARSDNDTCRMMKKWGERVHFIHLRNVRRETGDLMGSFHEDEHLLGGTDMVSLIAEILKEENRRKKEGRADHQIPMRPDHGQDILDDLTRKAHPGYPSIGRLKGLAELRGVMTALSHKTYGI